MASIARSFTLSARFAVAVYFFAVLCNAQTPLGDAISAYKQGDLQRAATLFAQAAQGEQDLSVRAAIRLKLAWVQFQMNDQAKAGETLRAAITEDSGLSVPEGLYSREFVRLFHETKGAVVSPWSYAYEAKADCKPGTIFAMAKSRSDVYCGPNDSQFCIQFELSPKELTAPGQVTIDFTYDRLVSKGAGGPWTTTKEQARITDTVNPKEMYKYATHTLNLRNTNPRDQIQNITVTSIACNAPSPERSPTPAAATTPPPALSAECQELLTLIRQDCGSSPVDLYSDVTPRGAPCSVLAQEMGPSATEFDPPCCGGWIGQFVNESWTWALWIIRAKACVALLRRCARTPGCEAECERYQRELLPQVLRNTRCSSADDVLRFDCHAFNHDPDYPLCRLGTP